MTVAAIIVAAGRGTRAGGEVPKQWQALRGRPVLAINGATTASGSIGFDLTGGSSTLRGFIVQAFKSNGVVFSGGTNTLQGNWLGTDQRGGLHHFFGGLEFALGIHDLGAAFAFGFSLLGHRALHAVRQRDLFHFDGSNFDALW